MMHQQLVELLDELRLNTIKKEYSGFAAIAAKENKSFEQYLSMLANAEVIYRQEIKHKRLLREAKIPVDKNLDTYDFNNTKGINSRDFYSLCEKKFYEDAQNIVLFGDVGVGKTHLAIGLIKKLCYEGVRCYFTSTSALIEELRDAKMNLTLAKKWKKFDSFQLIVCDELGYIPQNKEGADLFFQFIAQRYERRSILITTNLTYSQWNQVFLDPITTAAAVDRIVHHCKTFNIQGTSWRQTEAKKRQQEDIK